jgi:hypothetical protein
MIIKPELNRSIKDWNISPLNNNSSITAVAKSNDEIEKKILESNLLLLRLKSAPRIVATIIIKNIEKKAKQNPNPISLNKYLSNRIPKLYHAPPRRSDSIISDARRIGASHFKYY